MQQPKAQTATAGARSGRAYIPDQAFSRSQVLCECWAEREEIQRLKWLESEKAGRDIGECAAVMRWVLRHRDAWRLAYRALLRLS